MNSYSLDTSSGAIFKKSLSKAKDGISVTFSEIEQIKLMLSQNREKLINISDLLVKLLNTPEFLETKKIASQTANSISEKVDRHLKTSVSLLEEVSASSNIISSAVETYTVADSILEVETKALCAIPVIGTLFSFGALAKVAGKGLSDEVTGNIIDAGKNLIKGNFFGAVKSLLDFRSLGGNVANATSKIPHFIYEGAINGLVQTLQLIGFRDSAKIIGNSKVGVFDKYKNVALSMEELEKRKRDFIAEFKDRVGFSVEGLDNPKNLPELFFDMNYIGELGGHDQTVVRIYKTNDGSNRYIVLIPPTNENIEDSIAKGGNTMSNNWFANLNVIDGESSLMHIVSQAIDEQLSADNVDKKDAKIMIGGFSQGGLTAAAFSSFYKDEYNIETTISLGAPIEHFRNIKSSNHVVSYGFENDPVVGLDGTKTIKRKNWEVFNLKGGFHDAAQYAHSAFNGNIPSNIDTINAYLKTKLEPIDFYIVKEDVN